MKKTLTALFLTLASPALWAFSTAELAQTLQQQLHQQAQHEAYRVTLSDKGKVQWQDPDHPEQPPATTEPQASLFKRALSKFLSWLPIERLL